MRKLFSIFVILSLNTFMSISQPCLPEGITFTTQEEIDNFQINYPDCSHIEGGVLIEGNDITNLQGLSILEIVDGFF